MRSQACDILDHIEHLQVGWAYVRSCGYCNINFAPTVEKKYSAKPKGPMGESMASVRWYKAAQASGRDRIPLREYPA